MTTRCVQRLDGAHNPALPGATPGTAMHLATKADVAIKDVTHPKALSPIEVLETIGWFDANRGTSQAA